jgi:hypothetical protein
MNSPSANTISSPSHSHSHHQNSFNHSPKKRRTLIKDRLGCSRVSSFETLPSEGNHIFGKSTTYPDEGAPESK